MKNCDLGRENAALGLQPWVVFSRPWPQFSTIWTSQPANNICMYLNKSYLSSTSNVVFLRGQKVDKRKVSCPLVTSSLYLVANTQLFLVALVTSESQFQALNK